jgi:hypothetical protein
MLRDYVSPFKACAPNAPRATPELPRSAASERRLLLSLDMLPALMTKFNLYLSVSSYLYKDERMSDD